MSSNTVAVVAEFQVNDDAWEEAEFDEFGPTHLIATITVNGCFMHLEAVAVAIHRAKGEALEVQIGAGESNESYDRLYDAFDADGRFETVTIKGREFAIFASPYCE